ncbi:DUF2442 domain-containing protein [Dyella nitratireducens]|uniref:DUF2442 domain-containing protein n=1 Tax=Dyella nitratireducens TaxID=1849580 RepID=A0ABQ1G307_9GAMM|nr:DUF2442 domain-containing protein [Dyella nitratireducens]GGA35347.1 hypothetical protein GCM10010981_25550 [Dyella nitratireducens]GLQ40990.1 hypothetical protein GCM10007902_08400 [Dyella nitratireducens]
MTTCVTASAAPHPNPLPGGERGAASWRVVAVTAMPAYRLDVRFRDGTSGIVDMSALVNSDSAGVFLSLREPAVFSAVRIELGALAWPGEIDLAPDALYASIKAKGDCVLSAEGVVQ